MTPHVLPPETTPARRWTPARKFEVCRLILTGEHTFAEAAARYQLTDDELQGWIERFRRFGVAGLSVTRLQEVGRHG